MSGKKHGLQDKYKKLRMGGMMYYSKGALSEKQKVIAAKAPPLDKIDGKDFAVLKKEKAKGRGMGLQDEKMKPGKPMKAALGALALGAAGALGAKKMLKGTSSKSPGTTSMTGMGGMAANLYEQKKKELMQGKKDGGVMKAKDGKFAEVMDEFKKGELKMGKSDKKVKNKKQAIAIALSESKKKNA